MSFVNAYFKEKLFCGQFFNVLLTLQMYVYVEWLVYRVKNCIKALYKLKHFTVNKMEI